MHSILLATRNTHKITEFQAMLDGVFPKDVQLQGLDTLTYDVPEVIEDRDTFVGNAIKKAVEVAQFTNTAVMAEDSGLEVAALGGAPGVRSKRFSGDDATTPKNNALLIQQLQALAPDTDRTANYISVIALALPPGQTQHALLSLLGHQLEDLEPHDPNNTEEGYPSLVDQCAVFWWCGKVFGQITDEAQGEHGFGYDPHFFVPNKQRTMAQLTLEEKNLISHRSNALFKVRRHFSEAQVI